MTAPAVPATRAAIRVERASARHRWRRHARGIVLYLGSFLFVFWALAPILWVIISSISTRTELYAVPIKQWIPENPTLQNYKDILTTGPKYRGGGSMPTADLLFSGLKNSVEVAVTSAVIITILASFGGYVFARMSFPGRNMAFLAILLLVPLPFWVSLTTLYFTMAELGLLDRNLGLIIIYSALVLPLPLWMMTTFIRDLPQSLEDAAVVDGASRLRTIWDIVLPLARPGMTSVFLISALAIWNSFLIPLVFTSSQASQPLTVVLSLFVGQYEVAWEAMAAPAVLVMLPPLLLAFFFQRYLVRGMFIGGTGGE
jgi:multiple sugar transport system permease protein